MRSVVEDLVLVLSRSIVDTAVATFRNLPFEPQIKVIRYFLGGIDQTSTLSCARQHPILDLPVAGVFPAVQVLSIEKQCKPWFIDVNSSG
jgi:hypothetical protein